MCAATRNRQKLLKPFFEGLRSFKVTDVDTPKKLVTSACYHKQDVCAYLQLLISMLNEAISVK